MDRSVTQTCQMCRELAEFYCNGCNKTFCQLHSDEHRRSLYDQLDWLTVDHDDLSHTLNNTSTITHTSHSSRKMIDEWEEESIKYIKKTANEARRALIDAIHIHITDVKEKLKLLTEKLNQVYQDNKTFDETNLKQWATELRNLKDEFITTPTFKVRIHGNKPVVMPIIKIQPDPILENPPKERQKTSFGLVPIKHAATPGESSSDQTKQEKSIPQTSVDHSTNSSLLQKDDRFHSSSDHVNILDNGQVIKHDSTKNDASIRGFQEYSQGEHKLFFRIECLTSDQWIFFGITSKQASLNQRAYMDPSAHGWAGYNRVYINGKSTPTINGYASDMKINDYVELTIDCDRKTLFLWHSHSTSKNKLPIDIRTCPFPWQLLISCHNANDSIRILPSTMGSMIKCEQDKLNNDIKLKEIGLKTDNDYLPMRWGIHIASTVR
jgi:hypothetical protein